MAGLTTLGNFSSPGIIPEIQIHGALLATLCIAPVELS